MKFAIAWQTKHKKTLLLKPLRSGLLLAVCCSLQLANATPASNLALTGTASESSNYRGLTPASLAIDGNTNGDFGISVASTDIEAAPWWMVDLGNTYLLESIELWNRTDCCPDRLSNFHVSVLDSGQVEVWGQDFFTGGGFPNPNFLIALPGNTNGEFVKIQLNSENYLTIAEVIVMGDQVGVPEPASTALVMGGIAVIIARAYRDKARLSGNNPLRRQ